MPTAVKYQTPDVVNALLTQHPQTIVQSPLSLTRQHVNMEQRSVGFICSTEGTKRDGHSVRASGWQLDNYLKAGAPVLWCHNAKQDLPPIGRAPTMRVDGKQLVADVIFANEEFSDKLFRMYAADPPFMRAASVNWRPLEWQPNVDEFGRIVGNLYTRQDLLELSLVAVGADPDALSRAIQSGILTGTDVEQFVRRVGIVPTPYLVRLNDATDEASEPTQVAVSAAPSLTPQSEASSSSAVSVAPAPVPRTVTPPTSGESETRSSPPAPARLSSAPSYRGEFLAALEPDDTPRLWEAIDKCARLYGTLARVVYEMQAGGEDPSSRVRSVLSEFTDFAQPVLCTIANNLGKQAIPFRQIERRMFASGGEPAEPPPADPPPPVPPPVDPPPAEPPAVRQSVTARLSSIQSRSQEDQLRARVAKLSHDVTPPVVAHTEEPPTQQQLYFDRAPAAHAFIAADLKSRLDKLGA